MKITFIGGGNMGEAIIKAVTGKKISRPEEITVGEKLEDRQKYLAQEHNVEINSDNAMAVVGSDVVVLAVKPQSLAPVLTELNGKLTEEQLVVSIIAGARIETIRRGLNHAAIVRSMPNTPAQIGEGVTVWTATPEVNQNQLEQASMILGAMGKEFHAPDESFLDAATAVSGSGPAYLFYFVEALTDAAIDVGFDRDTAKELAKSTALGASKLLQSSGQEAADLRRAVTSPGGTTAAALKVLEEDGFHALIIKAVKAAHHRAQELGKA